MPGYEKTVQVPGKSGADIYAKVDAELERFLSRASLGDAKIDRDRDRLSIAVKSGMFTGKLQCFDGGMKLDGKLSLLALPFKSKLDEGIDKWVSKFFA